MGGYSELTEAQVEEFVETGIVRIEGAFSRSYAAEWVRRALERLGVDEQGVGTEVYMRAPPEDEIEAKVLAPRAWAAIEDLLGGADRVDQTAWRGGAGGGAVWQSDLAGNFGTAAERAKGDASWVEPSARDERNVPVGSWHKDGGHFRHFLDSPEQGLLTVVIWSDILPRSGGTFCALDSIGPVARLLASQPAGIHPDSVQGSGYLIPSLISGCENFVELTGRAGDIILM